MKPILIPFLFIRDSKTGAIFKINTAFLFESSGCLVKDALESTDLEAYDDCTIIVPNLIFSPSATLKNITAKFEFLINTIQENNPTFHKEQDARLDDSHLIDLKNKFFDEKERSHSIEPSEATPCIHNVDDFLLLHQNAFKLLECIEIIMQQHDFDEETNQSIRNLKQNIHSNFKKVAKTFTVSEEVFQF